MRKIRILWTDDEVEVLKPHIIFLKGKGYEVETCSSGRDTIDIVSENRYDILFLDENMPGLSGIETLKRIKELKPSLPVIMITKSEEENIMEAAIGSKIADYLIKPVKPTQILLAIKKIIDSPSLVTAETTNDYQADFGHIRELIDRAGSLEEWIDIYRKIVHWDLQLDNTDDPSLRQIHQMQEQEANNNFSRFIMKSYPSWIEKGAANDHLMSHQILESKVFPLLKEKRKIFLVVIDNLRFDQWKMIAGDISSIMRVSEESVYCSILPTATQYARNALFAGMMPSEIKDTYPGWWIDENLSEGKNNFEKELLSENLEKNGIDCKWSYHKINSNEAGEKVNNNIANLLGNNLNVLVYNFIDMLSHARTDTDVLRDIANDEPAYRTLTRSWFAHSPLLNLFRQLASKDFSIVITTDHGTIRVANPVKVIGDRNSSQNLRYKQGRNLDYEPSKVFEIKQPADLSLPSMNISSKYIFARNYDYLLYPKNYNRFVSYFKNTFQHGGISMQEMLIPFAIIDPH